MPDESPHSRIVHLVTQAVRWRPRNNRQVWLIVLVLVIAVCGGAIAEPARLDSLPSAVAGLVVVGLCITGLGQRREREALAARPSTVSRNDIPADVIELAAVGKRLRAIKRYRELTDVSLQEAKVIIDGL